MGWVEVGHLISDHVSSFHIPFFFLTVIVNLRLKLDFDWNVHCLFMMSNASTLYNVHYMWPCKNVILIYFFLFYSQSKKVLKKNTEQKLHLIHTKKYFFYLIRRPWLLFSRLIGYKWRVHYIRIIIWNKIIYSNASSSLMY